MVLELMWCSNWIIWAGVRRTMSCVRKRTSTKVTPRIARTVPDGGGTEHRKAKIILRHRHLKPSFLDVSTDRVIWHPQELQTMAERNSPTPFSNCIPTSALLKREVRNSLLGTPSSPSVARSYEVQGIHGKSNRRCWYVVIMSETYTVTFIPLYNTQKHTNWSSREKRGKRIWRIQSVGKRGTWLVESMVWKGGKLT